MKNPIVKFSSKLSAQRDTGLLLLRIMMGIILIWSGWVKITKTGWAIGFFDKVGIPIASVSGPFVTLLEGVGGIALILGFLTRILGCLYAIEFVVAAYMQWFAFGKGYPGAQLELLLLFTAVLLATHGAGKYSLDAKLKLDA